MVSPDLNLEAVFQSQVEALSLFEARCRCPIIQFISIEAEPQVTASVCGPILVMRTQVRDEQASVRLEVLFRLEEEIYW